MRPLRTLAVAAVAFFALSAPALAWQAYNWNVVDTGPHIDAAFTMCTRQATVFYTRVRVDSRYSFLNYHRYYSYQRHGGCRRWHFYQGNGYKYGLYYARPFIVVPGHGSEYFNFRPFRVII